MAKKKYPFTTTHELDDMIDQYFNDIEEKNIPDEEQIKNTQKRGRSRTKALSKANHSRSLLPALHYTWGIAAGRHLKITKPKANLPIILNVPGYG